MRELVRLASAFLDHGQAMTPMPNREVGFLRAVAVLYASSASEPRGAPGIRETFRAIARERRSAVDAIDAMLDSLHVAARQKRTYLSQFDRHPPGVGRDVRPPRGASGGISRDAVHTGRFRGCHVSCSNATRSSMRRKRWAYRSTCRRL